MDGVKPDAPLGDERRRATETDLQAPQEHLQFVLAELSMLATRSTVTPSGLVANDRGPWMVVYQPEWERIFNRERSALSSQPSPSEEKT